MRRVLVLESDKESLEILSKVLGEAGHAVQSAEDSEAALHRLRAWKPHLIIMNADLKNIDALDLAQRIRTMTVDEYTGVILLSSCLSIAEVKKTMELGADDLLSKPFRPEELVARITVILKFKEIQDSLKRANHRIEELNSTDDLTGLMNMRAVYRRGEEEIVRSKRFRKPVSSMLINLDGFSHVNQCYGFMVGSQILQEAAARVKQCFNPVDLLARVGADEFFVLLVDTDVSSAEKMAEKVRDLIQANPFKNEKQSIKLTATIGVAGIPQVQNNQKMGDLLHFTTEALRSAKANGSNRVEVHYFTQLS